MSGIRAGLRRWWAEAGERQERGGYSAGKVDPDKIPPPPTGPAPGALLESPAGRRVLPVPATITYHVAPGEPGYGPLTMRIENVSEWVIAAVLSEIHAIRGDG